VSRTHELKTWPEPFQAILDGVKRYEIRNDDRGFAVGDELLLREYDPGRASDGFGEPARYTGRSIRARVTYATHGRWGLPFGLCVMSIEVTP
jgi:hypothetical protein